jgi:hypothetical protein
MSEQTSLRWFPYTYDSVSSFQTELGAFRIEVRQDSTRVDPADDFDGLGNVITLLLELFRDGERRIRLASPDLFVDFDRQRSEAELRDTLLLPLPVALVTVLLNTALPVLTEVGAMVVLALLLGIWSREARQLDRAAHSLLLGALTDHTFSVSALDRMNWVRSL